MPRPVLVVEDETDLATTYRRLLQSRDCGVTAAGTRQEALAALRQQPLALVVAELTTLVERALPTALPSGLMGNGGRRGDRRSI